MTEPNKTPLTTGDKVKGIAALVAMLFLIGLIALFVAAMVL